MCWPTEVSKAKGIVVYEDFDTLTCDGHVVLVQLSSTLQLNPVGKSMCRPCSTEPLSASETCAVAGWAGTSAGDCVAL